MTRIENPRTGESHLRCETCPATYHAPEPHMPPGTLKRRAETEGWTAEKQAAEWRHWCAACSNFRKRRLL